MSKTEDFLSKSAEQKIVQAIIEAEKNTSGEIRVHLEEHSEESPLERAQEVIFLFFLQCALEFLPKCFFRLQQ